MKAAIAQISSSDDPAHNLRVILGLMDRAAGADIFFTPEVTNCISDNPATVAAAIADHNFLDEICVKAAQLNMYVLLGSLAVLHDAGAPKFFNRSFFIDNIDNKGRVCTTYDKIHMFDVGLSDDEVYQESRNYIAGEKAVICDTPLACFGLSIYYDLRFAHLYRALAQNGAQVITVPAAFAVPTGRAHWHVLLHARAIETGCFIIAPAQVEHHAGSNRKTYGHSLVVNPWGEIIMDAGKEVGLSMVDIDLSQVVDARAGVPSLAHDRPFDLIKGTAHG